MSVAGRVVLSAMAANSCFATLRDGSGDLQMMIALDAVGRRCCSAGGAMSTLATTSV